MGSSPWRPLLTADKEPERPESGDLFAEFATKACLRCMRCIYRLHLQFVYSFIFCNCNDIFLPKLGLPQTVVCPFTAMQSIRRDLLIAWSVCLSVSVGHKHELCKTAEPIEMSFGLWTRVNRVLPGSCQGKGQLWGGLFPPFKCIVTARAAKTATFKL